MTDEQQVSRSDERRAAAPPPPGPRRHAAVAASLRQVALHQETASLLELRAAHAPTDEQAALLRHRARQHLQIAHRLRQELAVVLGRPSPTASSPPGAR